MPTKTKPSARPTSSRATASEPVATSNAVSTPVGAADAPDFLPSTWTGWMGVVGFMAGVLWLNKLGPTYLFSRYWEGLILLGFTALPMIVWDAITLRRQTRGKPIDGMTRFHATSVARVITKLVGLTTSVALLALLYWVFPEYYPSFRPDGGFYSNFFTLCRLAGPWALLACAIYFFLIDSRLREPRDGYWHLGRVALLSFDEVEWPKVWNHLRTWAVKGFFMPLMFVFLCDNLPGLHFHGWPDFNAAFVYLHNLLFTVDLAFVSCGYLLTLRWIQSHVRSAEPTGLGWTAALVCYLPFWKFIGDLYLGYWGDRAWDNWLRPGEPLYYAWGIGILAFETIFVWATVSFGLRFSNLTHRGIVRHGPYYFTKHPAYISKICAFAMISVPWLDSRGWAQGTRNCLMLAGLAFIYWIRARTEERHLASIDSAYGIYADEVRSRHRRWLGIPRGLFYRR